MNRTAILRSVDAVMIPVPDIEEGLRFYRDRLGHELAWRNDDIGQAGLRLPASDTELVLTTTLDAAVNWLVESADDAVVDIVSAGGSVVVAPTDIPVGRLAVVNDPFGNTIVLLDLSIGRYVTGGDGRVVGAEPADA